MSKFRLALVRQKYRPDGGAERFVSRALEALDSSHLQLNVITREWQGPVKPDWQIHICNPRKWGRISRERGFANAARARSGSASPSTWCRAMNVFPAAISTALAMAFIAALAAAALAHFTGLEKPPAVRRPLPPLRHAGGTRDV